MNLTIELKPVTFQGKTELSKNESEEIKKNVNNHREAAKHHELAAKYHLDAARHHESGNYYEAEQSAFIAQGHCTLASINVKRRHLYLTGK